MDTTIILTCSCSHDFQDKKYGKQKRLHNTKKNGFEATCTVCKTKNRVSNLNSK